MADLTFYGPFHFDDIEGNGEIRIVKNEKRAPNPTAAGIYIWGFMYYYNKRGLIAPVNFRNTEPDFQPEVMKFIPYYVGKIESSIFKRIKQHQDVKNKKGIGSDGLKYTRLSHSFMHVFFKDLDDNENFPITTKGKRSQIKKLAKNHPSKITYYNDGEILREIYPFIQPKEFTKKNNPINKFNINGHEIPDTLGDLVDCMNNFWFCYALVSETNLPVIKSLETTTYYSLEGKTISDTGSCPKNNQYSIEDTTETHIFNITENMEIQPIDKFPGYKF